MNEQKIRAFETGATRNSDAGKNDYEGFLSPEVLRAYGDYMTENRVMADGSLRDSDNWQKGIPRPVYMKSLIRHLFDLWRMWRGYVVEPDVRNGVAIPWTLERLCCAVMFNVMGFLHETLKKEARDEKVVLVKAAMQDALNEMRAKDDREVFEKVEGSMCDAKGNYVGFVPQNKMGKGYRPEEDK